MYLPKGAETYLRRKACTPVCVTSFTHIRRNLEETKYPSVSGTHTTEGYLALPRRELAIHERTGGTECSSLSDTRPPAKAPSCVIPTPWHPGETEPWGPGEASGCWSQQGRGQREGTEGSRGQELLGRQTLSPRGQVVPPLSKPTDRPTPRATLMCPTDPG